MKFFKWKIFIITGIVCLLPIFFGAAFWNKLPETMAIHFNIYGEPDGFASKTFVVYGLPILMVLIQAFYCFAGDFQTCKNGKTNHFDTVSKWLVPTLTVVLYVLTIGVGIGWKVDMRKAACLVVGAMFFVIGACLPKADRIKNYKIPPEKALKINRFTGVEMVILGILFVISCFLTPMYSAACMFLLILFTLISIIYAIIVIRKK